MKVWKIDFSSQRPKESDDQDPEAMTAMKDDAEIDFFPQNRESQMLENQAPEVMSATFV